MKQWKEHWGWGTTSKRGELDDDDDDDDDDDYDDDDPMPWKL